MIAHAVVEHPPPMMKELRGPSIRRDAHHGLTTSANAQNNPITDMFRRRVINIPLYRRFQCQFTFTWRQTFATSSGHSTAERRAPPLAPARNAPRRMSRPKITHIVEISGAQIICYEWQGPERDWTESAGMKPLYKDRIRKASSVFVCCIVFTVSNGCDRITAVAPYDAPDAILEEIHNVLFFMMMMMCESFNLIFLSSQYQYHKILWNWES